MYGNPKQNAYIGRILSFIDSLLEHGMTLWANSEFSDYLQANGLKQRWTPAGQLPAGLDCIVSIGGDGTFLRAAQWAGDSGVPILGINTGHLGFLASYSFDETDLLIDVLTKGNGRIEPRMLLHVECDDMPADFWPYALNEVAIIKSDSASMVNVRTWINNGYLADYLSDGLIVSTPTGSTAYNLSVGGPILEPTASNIVLSPIAAHSLTMRPLVVGGDAEVRAAVISRTGKCRISMDGRTFKLHTHKHDENVEPAIRITRSRFTINILRRPDSHFAEILRNKLLWGTAIREL